MGATRTRLTTLAHGGGCGCKLAPAVLQELLHGKKAPLQFPGLLVGTETTAGNPLIVTVTATPGFATLTAPAPIGVLTRQ